jgi:hypothetical protein
MSTSADDMTPPSTARPKKIASEHGAPRLENEHIHLPLIAEAAKGLDDVAAGRVKDAREALQALKRRRVA